jgi:translation initiation factor 1 (eIF-1/SUI1)
MPREKKCRVDETGDISLDGAQKFEVSIGSLLNREHGADSREKTSSARENPVASAASNTPSGPEEFLKQVSSAILRRESAGRGGRIVTVVDFRPAPGEKTASDLAKMMRKSLGCGSHVELPRVILHGDIKDRAAVWLTKQGVKKTVMGN